MPRTETVTLGETEFSIQPLSLDQLCELIPVMQERIVAIQGNDYPKVLRTSMQIIALAAEREASEIGAVRGATLTQVNDATQAVLVFAGMVPKPGEAKADEALEPNLEPSANSSDGTITPSPSLTDGMSVASAA